MKPHLTLFRELGPAEEEAFRQWARDNYTPGEEISELWHPTIQAECKRMEEEHLAAQEDSVDYLRNLSERLRSVPVMYGVDGADIDRLQEIATELEEGLKQWT